jgi:copper chaperone
MTSVVKVHGMSCQHCVMSVKKALGQVEGIRDVQVDLENGEVRFENTGDASSEMIRRVLSDAGYEVVSNESV